MFQIYFSSLLFVQIIFQSVKSSSIINTNGQHNWVTVTLNDYVKANDHRRFKTSSGPFVHCDVQLSRTWETMDILLSYWTMEIIRTEYQYSMVKAYASILTGNLSVPINKNKTEKLRWKTCQVPPLPKGNIRDTEKGKYVAHFYRNLNLMKTMCDTVCDYETDSDGQCFTVNSFFGRSNAGKCMATMKDSNNINLWMQHVSKPAFVDGCTVDALTAGRNLSAIYVCSRHRCNRDVWYHHQCFRPSEMAQHTKTNLSTATTKLETPLEDGCYIENTQLQLQIGHHQQPNYMNLWLTQPYWLQLTRKRGRRRINARERALRIRKLPGIVYRGLKHVLNNITTRNGKTFIAIHDIGNVTAMRKNCRRTYRSRKYCFDKISILGKAIQKDLKSSKCIASIQPPNNDGSNFAGWIIKHKDLHVGCNYRHNIYVCQGPYCNSREQVDRQCTRNRKTTATTTTEATTTVAAPMEVGIECQIQMPNRNYGQNWTRQILNDLNIPNYPTLHLIDNIRHIYSHFNVDNSQRWSVSSVSLAQLANEKIKTCNGDINNESWACHQRISPAGRTILNKIKQYQHCTFLQFYN